MSLVITPGLGGILQFQNFAPLAPALVNNNLNGFRDLPLQAQVETLASAYQHLVSSSASKNDLLESVGALIERMNGRQKETAADNFIISRLITEWSTLKASRTPVPPSPLPPPSPRRDRKSDRSLGDRDSVQFYVGEKGGLFPPSWLTFSGEMRDSLKIQVWGLSAKDQKGLIASEEANADFLVGVLAGWIIDLKTALTETGAKGAGRSGLASAPSVRSSLDRVNEMAVVMVEGARSGSSLSELFWRGYGAHAELRMAVNRLTTMRSLLAPLEASERSLLEDALYALDAAYLSFLLAPMSEPPGEAAGDSSARDEVRGEQLAKKLGEVMVASPNSSSIEELLRIVAREVRTASPTPFVRAFLRKLLPREIIRLALLVDLIRKSNQT